MALHDPSVFEEEIVSVLDVAEVDALTVVTNDVLGTGRTVRAAMNEIFDYGRPARITLAVLVQRTGHELPIRADVVGFNLDVDANQYIDLDSSTMQVSVGEKS